MLRLISLSGAPLVYYETQSLQTVGYNRLGEHRQWRIDLAMEMHKLILKTETRQLGAYNDCRSN